jgi:hypothetical protein
VIVAQYVAMFADPLAAAARDVYAVEEVARPPWVNAVHRPNAAEPVASGPVAVAFGDGMALGETLGVGVRVGAGVGVAVASTEALTWALTCGCGAPMKSWAVCWAAVGRTPAYAAPAPAAATTPAVRRPTASLLPTRVTRENIKTSLLGVSCTNNTVLSDFCHTLS